MHSPRLPSIHRLAFAGLLASLFVACGPRNTLAPLAECFVAGDCGSETRCEAGQCVPDGPVACDPGRSRCATADLVETCADSGDRWEADLVPCPGGCDYGRCLARACRPFDLRCNGLTLLVCTADGSRFELFEQCRHACRVLDGEAQCTAE